MQLSLRLPQLPVGGLGLGCRDGSRFDGRLLAQRSQLQGQYSDKGYRFVALFQS